MSKAPHLLRGQAAEDAAARHLEQAGYQILCRNFSASGGELDVVAMDGQALAIVEVRYRADDRFGGAAASITASKRSRLIRATRTLLARQPALARLPARFDVVEVAGGQDAMNCQLIKGAFSLER